MRPAGAFGALSRDAAVGLQDAPGDLGARLFGLGGLDQAARGVAVEFGKLVAIDFEIVDLQLPLRQRPRRVSGSRTARLAPTVEQGSYEPEQHGVQ